MSQPLNPDDVRNSRMRRLQNDLAAANRKAAEMENLLRDESLRSLDLQERVMQLEELLEDHGIDPDD